ncbi:hypothetical protein FHG87_007892 [Trinorchestia longiramus]|nr:hypothetical protein FHG87_007892 [Trinorchestia longiramus]
MATLGSPLQQNKALHGPQPNLPFTITPTRARRPKGMNQSLSKTIKRKIIFDVTPLNIPGSEHLALSDTNDCKKMELWERSRSGDFVNNHLEHTLNGSYDAPFNTSNEKKNCPGWSSAECNRKSSTCENDNSTRTHEAKVSLVVTNMRKKKVIRRRINFNMSIKSSCDSAVVKKLSFSIESSNGLMKSHEPNDQHKETLKRISHLQHEKRPVCRRLSFSSPVYSTKSSKDLSLILAAAITSEAVASTSNSSTPGKFQINHTVNTDANKLSPPHQFVSKGTHKIKGRQRVRGRRDCQQDGDSNKVLPKRLKFSPAGVDSSTLDRHGDVNYLVVRGDSPVSSRARSYRRKSPKLTQEFIYDHLVECSPNFTEERASNSSILSSPAARPKVRQKLGEEPIMYIYRDPEPGSSVVPSPMPVYRPSKPIPKAMAVLPKIAPVVAPAEKKKKKRSELPLHPMLFQLVRQSVYHEQPWERLLKKMSN